ncbi:hypothetical protein P3342_010604 [Pyrenophora teres f. teres]|nr:hypothetical protein P3342_010604 [Pyrenophora teres f. teres]
MKTGPYGFVISNDRVRTFCFIQERTGSKLGNGRFGLHTSIDADGVITEHGLAATEEEIKDEPVNSWGLMREDSRQTYRKKKKERTEERDRVKNFRDWCIGIHDVHGELYNNFSRFDTMPPFDLEPLIKLYGKAHRSLSKIVT